MFIRMLTTCGQTPPSQRKVFDENIVQNDKTIIMYLLIRWLILTMSFSNSFSQGIDTSAIKGNYQPEILTSGFIDIINNGQVNASARFIRLYIGEPGKFAIPISIYSGVSANNFSNGQHLPEKTNNHLVNNFINPLSGLVNVSLDGIIFLERKIKLTRTGILYHLGEKVLTGFKRGAAGDPQSGRPVTFLNSFASAGGYFQTGAWERNDMKNVGIFWLTVRYIGTYTNPKNIRSFLPDIETTGLYHGYSVGSGVEINDLVNLKILYYRYIKKPEIDYGQAIYQLSFNYALKK